MFNENDSNFSGEVIISNLEASLQNVYSNLNVASNSENFLPTVAPIFGKSEDLGELQTVVERWTLNDFSQLPPIEILPNDLMNGANAAFSEETSTIYISSEYFSQDFSNPDVATGATGFLLEEVGHFVDALINPGSDTAGDEGELFSATLMQLPLSSTDKQLINLEEDSGFVTIDNQEIAVEQSRKLPKITVRATEKSAEETIAGQTTDFGKFTLRRTGDTTKALTVNYTLGGTATNGTDYKKLDRKVTFAAGSATASIDVKPLDDNLLEANETLTLTLTTKRSYTIGTAKTATVNIANIDSRGLADFLWDKGDTVEQIGVELKNRGFDLPTIADALNDGITKSDGSSLDYSEVAQGIWNSGYQGDELSGGILADLLWDEGAREADITPALKNLGFSLPEIFVYLKGVTKQDGTGLSNKDISFGIWNSEYKDTEVDPGIIADLLWDSGVSQAEIGQTLKDAGFDLREIADAVDDKVTIDQEGNTLGYLDTAIAIWNSGYQGDQLNSRILADLLWDEGATEIDIAQASKYLGFGLPVIADAIKFGVTKSDGTELNYTSVAVGLWNSGYGGDELNTRILADLLWDTGANASQIGQALNYGIGRNLREIASDIKYGVTNNDGTGLNYTDVAVGLWNSGLAIDSRILADILWDEGASQAQIGQALRSIGISKEGIADAMDDGDIGFNYVDVALAVWNSGYKMSPYRLGVILREEGASFNEAVGALQTVAELSYFAALGEVLTGVFKDLLGAASQSAQSFGNKVENFYEDNKSTLLVVFPAGVIGVEIAKSVAKSIESGNIEPIVDGLKRIPVAGTAVGIIEGVVNAIEGDEKGVLKSAIDSALAFYGASNAITPKMVDFAVDIFWELKDSDYQGAVSETLNNLGLSKTVADIFVDVAWALENGDWETAVNAALTKVGFSNAKEFVDIAWDVIDKNYQGLLKTGLELVGFNALGIDRAKADAFVNITTAIKDGNSSKAADYLISLASNNAPNISQSAWVKDLKDGIATNDRQAIQTGLSELGFKNAAQWTSTIWAVKDGQYLNALSETLSLGNFKNAQEWRNIIENFQKENYLDALSGAFKLAGFIDGQSLAEAAIAVRDKDYIDAFYESFDLIEGGSDLKNAFKALKENQLQEFVNSMIGATPLLVKVLV